MSGISKRLSGSWVSGDYGIMKTATDTLTTLPADIYANDTTATVGLKGNMVQNGTPSPDNPIQPSECGDRTDNLYDYRKIVSGYTYDSDGQMILNPDTANRWRYAAVPLIEVEPSATYLRTYNLSPWGNTINFYDSNKNFLERATPGAGIPVTVPSNCNFVSFVFQIDNMDTEKYMFTKGSTAPSTYIPYGYKIPISSASTTTPIYLGEVQTTRKIKQLVLTGQENWGYSVLNDKARVYSDPIAVTMPSSIAISSHYPYQGTNLGYPDVGKFTFNATKSIIIGLNPNEYTSASDFKTYLQQQYANGTPVTIWYVLATETTGIVNEPLRKIGDYADEVSGISIPTIAGADSFDVLTTLKPSEVTVNYKGWHSVADVHERENGAWD